MSRFLLVLLVLGGLGCGTGGSSPDSGDEGAHDARHDEPDASTQAEDGEVDPATLPVIEITAEELSRSFQTDPERAAEEYKGRRLRLSGEIDSIPQVRSIYLTGWQDRDTSAQFAVAGYVRVEGTFPEPMPAWMATIHPTRKVVVEGICEGEPRAGFGPVVSQPRLVELGPGPAVEIESTALAAAFVTDAGQAETTYKGKWVSITGAVVDERDGDEYLAGATTEDGESIPVRCLATAFETVIGPEPITQGDVLVLHGACSGLTGKGDAVLVERAVVVSRKRADTVKGPSSD